MKTQCKTCKKNCEGDYCFKHKPRKPLQKTVKKEESIQQISEIRDFFLQIWSKRPHVSEVSGTSLGKEPLSVFFHHILSKEKYPQAALDEENIILLTLNEHDQVEMDMYRYENINEKRRILLDKYSTTGL